MSSNNARADSLSLLLFTLRSGKLLAINLLKVSEIIPCPPLTKMPESHPNVKGIAVLRVDDRGVGKSTGSFAVATTTDFMLDAQAALKFLRSRKGIDARRTGLLGHSEGALVAALLAAKDRSVGQASSQPRPQHHFGLGHRPTKALGPLQS